MQNFLLYQNFNSANKSAILFFSVVIYQKFIFVTLYISVKLTKLTYSITCYSLTQSPTKQKVFFSPIFQYIHVLTGLIHSVAKIVFANHQHCDGAPEYYFEEMGPYRRVEWYLRDA